MSSLGLTQFGSAVFFRKTDRVEVWHRFSLNDSQVTILIFIPTIMTRKTTSDRISIRHQNQTIITSIAICTIFRGPWTPLLKVEFLRGVWVWGDFITARIPDLSLYMQNNGDFLTDSIPSFLSEIFICKQRPEIQALRKLPVFRAQTQPRNSTSNWGKLRTLYFKSITLDIICAWIRYKNPLSKPGILFSHTKRITVDKESSFH